MRGTARQNRLWTRYKDRPMHISEMFKYWEWNEPTMNGVSCFFKIWSTRCFGLSERQYFVASSNGVKQKANVKPRFSEVVPGFESQYLAPFTQTNPPFYKSNQMPSQIRAHHLWHLWQVFSCCSITDKDNPWRQNSSPTENKIPHLFHLSKQKKRPGFVFVERLPSASGTWGETDKVLQNSFWPFNTSLWFFHLCHPPTTLLCARRCQAWKSFDRFKTYSSTNCLTRAWATALTRI